MSGRVVMVEKPIVLPLVWTSAANAFPQPLQNLTVYCEVLERPFAIEGLTTGHELLVDNALDVEKKRSMWT